MKGRALVLGLLLAIGSILPLAGCSTKLGPWESLRGDAMRDAVTVEGKAKITFREDGNPASVECKSDACKISLSSAMGGQMSPQMEQLAAQALFLGQQMGAASAGVPPGVVRPPAAASGPSEDQIRSIVEEALEEFTAPPPPPPQLLEE